MHILGIDLAASPASTGVVLLRPVGSGGEDVRWRAASSDGPADDDLLVELAVDALVVGVDAPLGWPDAFVAAVGSHHEGARWTGTTDRSPLTHRETDRRTRPVTGRLPLSVSADLLGVVAMRCALLQQRWADEAWAGAAPRDGTGRLAETYPAAAFAAWCIPSRGYKARRRPRDAAVVRTGIVESIERATGRWLDLGAIGDECIASDHVLDALVCALVAIAIRNGATTAPGPADVAVARREGWIHVPTGPLDGLEPPPPDAQV